MKNRIRELRKKHNLTLKELSSRLKETDTNISSDALGKYERGDRNPKIDKWQELADFLVCQFLIYKDMQKSIYLMISNLNLSKMRLIALKRS